MLCRELRLAERFDFVYLARNTPGYVGADLMALAREAAMVAVNRYSINVSYIRSRYFSIILNSLH